VPDVLAASGYVDTVYVIKLAQEAGFTLAAQSELNANPKDTRDHPFGVWTLPPVRRSSPRGEPADPAFDHAPFDAIGESDRMTLKFVKPA
jgi:predicted methyltransferase